MFLRHKCTPSSLEKVSEYICPPDFLSAWFRCTLRSSDSPKILISFLYLVPLLFRFPQFLECHFVTVVISSTFGVTSLYPLVIDVHPQISWWYLQLMHSLPPCPGGSAAVLQGVHVYVGLWLLWLESPVPPADAHLVCPTHPGPPSKQVRDERCCCCCLYQRYVHVLVAPLLPQLLLQSGPT